MKKEINILINYLKSTNLNNRQIAEKVGISAVAIGKIFEGQFPSKNISKFFAAFPDLSPIDIFGHYSNRSYKVVSVSQTEAEKQIQELKRIVKDLEEKNALMKIILHSRLSESEKELVKF